MAPEKSTRVLLVLNEIEWFWSHRLPVAKGILDRNWKLTLATSGASSDLQLSEMGITANDVPKLKNSYNIVALLNFMVSIAKAIKSSNPDILHVITIRYAFYVGLASRVIGFQPVIFTLAGLGGLFSSSSFKARLLKMLVTPILKLAFGGDGKYFIVQNPDDRNVLTNLGLVDSEQIHLIRGSGVDLKEFPYIPYEENDDPPKILFASRLLRDKGICDFIEAARILKAEGIRAEFIVAGGFFAGNSGYISSVEIESASENGVVEWLGQVDNVRELMRDSMIVVFPSYYGEGVPKVLLEAAATGRPIITCDVPGCREVVEHKVNGLLVPPKDPRSLANAIDQLVASESDRKSQGIAGRRLVEEEFHSEFVVEKTMEVYERALSWSQDQAGG